MKFSLVSLLFCGLVKSQVRVINGDVAAPFSYPFIVSLQLENGLHFCGGSLLDRETVLTAAHCYNDELKGVTANIHRHNITKKPEEENGIRIELDKAIVHEKYVPESSLADIAIWKLKERIPDNIKVQFVKLSTQKLSQELQLKNLTAIGWGRTDDGKGNKGTRATTLQVAHLRPVSNKECETNWSKYDTSDKICAKHQATKKQSICNGDSGGPLFYFDNKSKEFIQVGVVSLGEAYCTLSKQVPDAFIRVNPYVEWINSFNAIKNTPGFFKVIRSKVMSIF